MTRFVARISRHLVLFSCLGGALLTTGLVALAIHDALSEQRDLFDEEADLIAQNASRRLAAAEDLAHSLAMLFRASQHVGADEFALFAEDALARVPSLRSISYLPLVADRDRARFERVQQAAGSAGFRVSDDFGGGYAPAAQRDRYFPILFHLPLTAETRPERGLDLFGSTHARDALREAIEGAEAVASSPRRLGSEPAAYTIFHALYAGQDQPPTAETRRRAVSGVVAVTVAGSRLLDGLQTDDNLAVRLSLVRSAGGADAVVLDDLSGLPGGRRLWPVTTLGWTTGFSATGQRFVIEFSKAVGWRDVLTRLVAIALALGVVLTGLLAALARAISRRHEELQHHAAEVEDQVAVRTRELALEKDRALVTLGAIGDGVIAADGRGFVQYLNPVAERLCGWSTAAAVGRPAAEVVVLTDSLDQKPLEDPIAQCLRDGRDPLSRQGTVVSRNGVKTEVEYSAAPIQGSDGVPQGAVLVVHDVTEARKMAERMAYQATHDPLTNLPNRTLLMDRLGQALKRFPWHSRLVAVIFLDLDNFKLVNDSFGHDVGDQLIQQAAQRLTTTVRSGDTVCRWGGDEFVVVLTDLADRDDVMLLAEKIMTRLDEPYLLGGREYFCSASAGISVTKEHNTDPAVLLRNADVALYRAKESGRSNYQFYSDDMNRHAIKLLEIKVGLRQALERNEFVLHYQPQIDLASGSVIGAEALVRWNHPGKGLISPTDFIPVAEETGLIFPLSDWVLVEACRQAKQWRDQGLPPLRIAVNLSGRQFRQAAFAQELARRVRESGLHPSALELELTEHILVKDADAAVAICRELKAIGVRFAIDDFGTGYSSLSYLRRFPVNTLKVDRSFVRDLPHNNDAAAICSAIVAMAHSLGLTVVAEGVETEAQRLFLKAKGVDCAQGYLFGHPMPAEQFVAALSAPARPRAANG